MGAASSSSSSSSPFAVESIAGERFIVPIPAVIYNTVKTWEADKDRVRHFSASSREAPLLARYIQFINDCSAIADVQALGSRDTQLMYRLMLFKICTRKHPDVDVLRSSSALKLYNAWIDRHNNRMYLGEEKATAFVSIVKELLFLRRAFSMNFSTMLYDFAASQGSSHATFSVVHAEPVETSKDEWRSKLKFFFDP